MRKFTWLLALAVPVTIISCQKDAVQAPNEEAALVQGQAETGNGAPSGAHYNLEIIGVKEGHEKSINFDGGNGRRMFVKLDGRTKILLSKGDFDVVDANGTDGTAAFRLPEPDATDDGVTDYSVFVRATGNSGSAKMKSCYWDAQLQTEYCSTGEYIVNLTTSKGGEKFQNVSNQLLYVWADLDLDGDVERTELFSDNLDTYYWYYDNDGLKHAQMRFYPGVGTPVWEDPDPNGNEGTN